MKQQITEEQVQFWLCDPLDASEVLGILSDLANGDYKQNQLREDIINTCLSCNYVEPKEEI